LDIQKNVVRKNSGMLNTKAYLKVHSIESFGTHDGPGIRMVIFLQGCNLNCLYCQNPDTIATGGGKKYSIDDLVQRALNMKAYFGKTGGVTVSGGEPLLQTPGLIKLFKELKRYDIHTNIDSNGTCFSEDIKKLLDKYTDLMMIDVKGTSHEGFRLLTGKDKLNVLLKMVNHRESSKKPFWLRYVLIPGYTDSPGQLQWLGRTFMHFDYLERVEVLPYHQLGKYKWEAMGKPYRLEGVQENSQEQIKAARNRLFTFFKERLFFQ
jgi:pyruvate formate lyase activating enzyme